MTLAQTQTRPMSTDAAYPTAADAMDAAGLHVWEDMTVEVALSVMAAAHTGHLVVRDEDGQYTGLVTRDRLNTVRDGSGYSDRVRLRDITGSDGPVAPPLTTLADAERAIRHRRLGALPVVYGHGNALGVLAHSR
ncbi:CBS domain-containing protein [Streptomyces sp. E2N166]|uniref:CBS domain-containing protein n=1 Tax=Streptomyces sp. E2N166 TaxID=1851909 RepID=UPI000EF6A032|nr:CBS domain-containing protein [Streptomyces sp. E2N166]